MIRISLSIAVDEDAEGNENTCESDDSDNNLASLPAKPAVPCLDLVNDIVFESDTLAEVAVIVTEPLSCVIPLIVTVFPLSVAVTPGPLEDEIV